MNQIKMNCVSWQGALLRQLIALTIRTAGGDALAISSRHTSLANPNWQPPKGYQLESVLLPAGVRAEYLQAKEPPHPTACILQLHGGGYQIPYTRIHQKQSLRLSSLTYPSLPVLSLDYRVAPQNPYPAALEDAVNAINWLNKEKGIASKLVFIIGDSAGGGLALALAMYLRDHQLGSLAGLVLISPWTDLANNSPSHGLRRKKDPFFGQNKPGRKPGLTAGTLYAGSHQLSDPYISPVLGDFTDLPPMLIHVGEHEILYDDAARVHQQAQAAGSSSCFKEWPGLFHCFHLAAPLIPEARVAWKEIGRFIEEHLSVQMTEHKSKLADTYRLYYG